VFDPDEHFFGPQSGTYVSSKDYETQLYAAVEADLIEALKPGFASPVKAAYEVLRILRDAMRSVIEFGGLSPSSFEDFDRNIRNRVHRVVAGPPVLRSQELLALLDAGIVRAPFGPSPDVEIHESGATITSRSLERPYSCTVDYLVQGHLEDPTVHRSASPLLDQLYRSGRIRQFRCGDVTVGSIDLTADFHPVNADGGTESRIWIFGVLTEGARYFNHYIPSPKSRIRAFQDAQDTLDEILRFRHQLAS
jgi:hypothetical protein